MCLRYSPSAESEHEKSLEGAEFSNQNQAGPGFLSAPAESLLKTCCKQQSSAVNVEDQEPAAAPEVSTNKTVATTPALTLAQVNPGDYSPIPGGPLIEPCPVCGGRVVGAGGVRGGTAAAGCCGLGTVPNDCRM